MTLLQEEKVKHLSTFSKLNSEVVLLNFKIDRMTKSGKSVGNFESVGSHDKEKGKSRVAEVKVVQDNHGACLRVKDPLQMINLYDLVLNVVPLTTVEPIREVESSATPKDAKLSGKYLTSLSKMVLRSASRIDKSEKTNVSRVNDSSENLDHAKMQDVQTSSTKGTGSKENYAGVEIAFETKSKKKANVCVAKVVINLDDLSTDDDLLTNYLNPELAERLKKIKGKVVVVDASSAKTPMKKVRDVKGKTSVGLAKSWSKVVVPSRKRKLISSSDFKTESDEDVRDIMPHRRSTATKTCVIIPEKYAGKWQFVNQRRISLEREPGKYLSKYKDVEKLIEASRLRRTITSFGPCYEGLVKEFVISVSVGCDDPNSKD
ncbi:uncharacterized protein LOC131636192 [Vicia villosa]|uniref:uncharacterized protein LOC131636192 n=1 Tax=Vicia villosa TaxID=3911 RepID=UPI00273C6C88|nr:uncharacterized protein LOC131636192 [Vicia villosa]